MTEIQTRLLDMQDEKYRDFQAKLMPTVDKNRIIGVRTPLLRRYAKEVHLSPCAQGFLSSLPHRYYEEDNLHGFLIEYMTDFDACITALDKFLPFVDNWATCDGMNPRVLATQPDLLLKHTEKWLKSSHTYTVRFGILSLMRHFLEENFLPKYAETVVGVKSSEYYVNMMRAWYFATALAKQYDSIVPIFENRLLDPWTHRKAIQKACESYRISPKQKKYLKSLK